MKKHKKSLLRFSIVSLLFSVAFIGLNMGVISTASAITCPTGYVDTKGVCFPTTTGLSDKKVDVILLNVMNWLLGVLGFIAVIAFVISGIQYLLAAGDEKTIETAKTNMKYSIIGVIVALSGFVLITAIDSLLNASSTF